MKRLLLATAATALVAGAAQAEDVKVGVLLGFTGPLETTVRDTLDWWMKQSGERRAAPKAGLSPEREAEVLLAWHAAGHH